MKMRLGLLMTAAFLISACGGDVASTTTAPPAATTTVPLASTTLSPGEVRQVPHRLLADGIDGGGQPWTTAIVTTDEELGSLVPDATADWETEVVLRFTLAESGSCSFDEMRGLLYSAPYLRLYPEVPLVGEPDVCTDDADPHTIVVVVERADLPSGEFSLWVNGEEPPSGVVDGVTRVAAGELDRRDSGEVQALNADGDLPVGETRIAHDVTAHCGLDRIYRPIDGRQWVLADDVGDVIDYIPPAWEEALDGEQIDLLIERPEADRLLVTAVGTDAQLTYVPAPDTGGCD